MWELKGRSSKSILDKICICDFIVVVVVEIFFKKKFVYWCFTCMSIYHVHSDQGGQKRASDPETGVTDGCEQPYRCWESNLVLLEEQSMFLTPEPSLQPLCHLWKLALPQIGCHDSCSSCIYSPSPDSKRGSPFLGMVCVFVSESSSFIIWEVHAVCSDNTCLPPLPSMLPFFPLYRVQFVLPR